MSTVDCRLSSLTLESRLRANLETFSSGSRVKPRPTQVFADGIESRDRLRESGEERSATFDALSRARARPYSPSVTLHPPMPRLLAPGLSFVLGRPRSPAGNLIVRRGIDAIKSEQAATPSVT